MNIIKALVITSLACVVVACGGAEERKAAYLDKADQSFSAGDFEKARIELKNVLQIDPKDDRAYFMLGKVFEKKKDYRKAFNNYRKAAELNPDNLEYQSKIGLFYLLSGDINKAEEILKLIREKDINSVEGQLLQTRILFRQEKTEEAKAIALDVFNKYPNNIDNAVVLASIYSKDKDYAAAIDAIEAALKSEPDHQGLLTMLANLLFVSEDYARAEKILISIVNQYPEAFINHVNLAQFYIKTENVENAEIVLRSAVDLDESDVRRRIILVDFIQETKGNEHAAAEIINIISDNPGVGSYRLALAQIYIADNNIDEAISVYKSAINDFSEEETGINSRVQLAKIYMQRKDSQSAVEIIDDGMEINPNDSELNLIKAKIELHNKNIDQAIISLRTVINDDPQKIDAYILLAAAHNAINESEQANDILNRAYENNRTNPEALLMLSKHYFISKKLLDAEKIIDAHLILDENNYEALSIKSSILNGKKSYTEAYDIAQKLITLYPNKENGYIQSTPALLSNNEVERAIELLQNGYDKTKDIQILKLLAEVSISVGKADLAIAELNKAENKDEAMFLLLAKAYVANKDLESAKKTLLDSIMIDKARTQSYISLASAYSSENNKKKAISVLQDGVNANPDDMTLGISLAGFYEKTGDIDAAIQEYELILTKKPENLLANNNLAALLSDHKSDDASLKRAKEIADKLKNVNQPVILDTVGWVYYRTGNYVDAVSILEKVVEAQPGIQIFNYHLGMAYHKSGNNPEARKNLEAALASENDFQGRDVAEKTLKSL